MRGRQSLVDLIDQWERRDEPIPRAEVVAALSTLELAREDLSDIVSFDNRVYRRMVLGGSPYFQVLVLCWKSGQRSPVHDHTGSSCVVRVVQGRATETRFTRSPCGLLAPLDSRSVGKGRVIECDGRCIHQMANLGPPDEDLVTLHVYSPPPCDWRLYRIDETTLGDNDRLVREPAPTVIANLGRAASDRPVRFESKEPLPIMRKMTDETTQTLAIIGGGFSGSMVAVNLARRAGAHPIKILLFEKRDRFARGLAYGTRCDQHLLNVPAGLMSAFPDEPTHFLDWLQALDPSATHGTFAPRRIYGDYLEDLLRNATSGGQVELVHDEVVDLQRPPDRKAPLDVQTSANRTFSVDQVVLALGNPPAQDPPGLGLIAGGRGYVADPWSPEALEGLEGDETIALIGAGLTAMDLFVEAAAKGHRGKIVAISRHGLLPRVHRAAPPRPHFNMANPPSTARALLRAVRVEAAECQAEGGDWRSVVDGIRPVAQELWRSMGEGDRGRFVRHLAPRWDVHRHRIAPQIDDAIDRALQRGQLEVIAGRVVSFENHGIDHILNIRRRGSADIEPIRVGRVINCTGPSRDIRQVPSRLLQSLLAREIASSDPLALGLNVSNSGALIGGDGLVDDRILAIGPLLKGQLWETTAVRELRCQAKDLADRISSRFAEERAISSRTTNAIS